MTLDRTGAALAQAIIQAMPSNAVPLTVAGQTLHLEMWTAVSSAIIKYLSDNATIQANCGELYQASATSQTLASLSTIYKLTTWDTVGETHNTTPSVASSSITILQDGYYAVTFDASVSSVTANEVFTFYLFVNNTRNGSIASSTKVTNSNDIKFVGLTDINFFHANDVVDIRVQGNSNSVTMTVESGNFNVYSVGNSGTGVIT